MAEADAGTALENTAQAFDAIIAADPGKPAPRPRGKNNDSPEPEGEIFRTLGERDADSPPKGGGDDDPLSEEEILYGKDSADPRNPRKKEGEDSEGDDDESDGADAGGDEDDDADDASDADTETDPEEAKILGRKVEVTVDGEPVEVTIKEALEGYVRTSTFHQRMNQLDEAKKVVRRAAGDAVHNFEYSVNLAKEMEAYMEKVIPAEPNWDEEFKKDPAKARDLQKYYEQAKEFREGLRTKTVEIRKKQAEADDRQLQAFVEEETGKFDQMNRKQWADPKKKIKDLQSMRKTGTAMGFSEEELSSVYDSRMLQVLLKASKYDRMMAAKPKPLVRTTTKPVPPGTGSARQRTVRKGATQAMNRLNRTGSIEDAAVVFDHIIARG